VANAIPIAAGMAKPSPPPAVRYQLPGHDRRSWLRKASVLDGASQATTAFSGNSRARIAAAVDALMGSVSSTTTGSGRACGASRSVSSTCSSSAASASRGSATIASPIGARAASSGSSVICTSPAPSGR
jgi:hypothetical protein